MESKAPLKDEVSLVTRRAAALNERLRTLLRTMTAVERDDPEFAQEMRHYGIVGEFADIATAIGDLDTAVAALVRKVGFD